MRLSLTVRGVAPADVDVLVDVEPESLVGDLELELARTLGVLGPEGVWLDGARLDDQVSVANSPLRQGGMLALRAADATGTRPSHRTGDRRGWNLHVVGGPDAGRVLPLPIGEHVLGRGVGGLADESLSRRHLALRVGADGATVVDLGSTNGTTLDGVAVPVEGQGDTQGLPIAPGQLLAAADTQLCIVPASPADAAVHPGNDGTLEFTRPPRLQPAREPERIALPSQPGERSSRRIPVAAMIAPLVLGLVIAAVFRQPIYLLFALFSPIMAASNAFSDRRQSAKDHREAQRRYDEEIAAATERLGVALAEETVRRREEAPDAAATVLVAMLPTRRLWERRRADEDFLVLRVGTGDRPSRVELTAPRTGVSPLPEGPRTVYAVPVTVPLAEVGVLGLAGPREWTTDLARWLLVQACVQSGPRDVGVTVLAPRGGAVWNWVRWLPHAAAPDRDTAAASVGTDPETVAARVAELLAQLKTRQQIARGIGRGARSAFPVQLVVLDGARALRGTPGVAQLLADGPEVGIFALCLEQEDRLLPEECTATVQPQATMPGRLELRRDGAEPVLEVLAERIEPELALDVARALAPVREVVHEDEEASLPDAVRLLDVLHLEPPTADAVRARWQLEGRTTRLPLGVGGEGLFALDLRRDGPHGLIAGTTGSGKSELLQSMIASLAVGNRPDELNFVLVDYKGGSAFKDCVALPHTVGMVTDLDAHLVERALTSLAAELRRREHQLAAADVKDIEDYTALRLRGGVSEPMPRLLIVIDEFASMARELPDFVAGLVNIAQRGRSLGIHLLLATQRPSGVVSADIRANTNLRISLRVTDAGDSVDVLDAPDAARIPKSVPGRAYARLGHAALLPFQAGRVGGLRPGVRPTSLRPPFVAQVGWGQLGYPSPRPVAEAVLEDDELTDLSVLVGSIREAAAADAVPAQRSPWLLPLPESIVAADLPAPAATAGVSLPYGLEDRPASQEQVLRSFDLASDGHLLAIGSPRSGRSQLLRTLAGAVAARYSTEDVHLYALDCGNGALLPLTALPHCGAVVTRVQTERVGRLLARLLAELERRQDLLASAGHADISEQRAAAAPGERLPHLLLLLDRWEGFVSSLGEIDGGRLTEAVLTLLREGASVGISAVLTGDRSLGTGRLGSLTENKIALRLADRNDYTLIGLSTRQLPVEMGPGRAVTTETGTEVQIALLHADPSGQRQAGVLAELGAAAAVRDGEVPRSRRPFRVDDLPARISFEQAFEQRPEDVGPLTALVGVGGDELTGLGPDLASVPSFLVAGPGKSGRSTALVTIAESLLRLGAHLVLVTPRPSPLRDLAGRPGVTAVVTDVTTPADRWRELLDAGGDDPLVVVIDDGEALKDCPANEIFRSIIKGMAGEGRALVLGGHAEGVATGLSGWQVEVKKARCGLLLSPQQPLDGDLLGVRLPRSAVGQPVKPGRGLLHLGDGRVVAVALPDTAAEGASNGVSAAPQGPADAERPPSRVG